MEVSVYDVAHTPFMSFKMQTNSIPLQDVVSPASNVYCNLSFKIA